MTLMGLTRALQPGAWPVPLAGVARDAVEVRPSEACGGGLGVFARRPIAPRETLAVVPGAACLAAADAPACLGHADDGRALERVDDGLSDANREVCSGLAFKTQCSAAASRFKREREPFARARALENM